MKRMVTKIVYDDWMLATDEDAVRLLAIMSRAVKLKRDKYNTPYYPDPKQEPAVTSISLEDVAENAENANTMSANDGVPF